MKTRNKLLQYGIFLIILVIISIVSYNFGYAKGSSKTNNNNTCTINTDCKTPMEYSIRSSCPFESKCIDNKCNVVCVSPYKDKQDELNKVPQCNKDTDCNCTKFYAPNDIKKCSCLDGLCTAIVTNS